MNILEAYSGNMDKFLSLLRYSKVLKEEDEKQIALMKKAKNFHSLSPNQILRQLVWGFDFSQRHSFSTLNPETFNILKRTTLTQNKETNKEKGLELLWKLSCAVEKDKSPLLFYLPQLVSMSKILDQKRFMIYHQNLGRTKTLLEILCNLVENDFSFIIQANNLKRNNEKKDEILEFDQCMSYLFNFTNELDF
jgi:hypothetical protein